MLSEMTDERIDQQGNAALGWGVRTEIMGYPPATHFEPAQCIQDARKMESRLAEMGLEAHYASHLMDLLPDEGDPALQGFAVAHASPRDRCRAALRAVRDSKQRERADGS